MKRIITLFFSLSIFAIMFSCSDDNIDDLKSINGFEEEAFDTIKVISFTNDILPIMNSHCTDCHEENSPNGTVLTNHDNISNNATSVLRDITSGRMPKGAPKLSENEILTVKTWIDNGKKNN